MKKAKGWLLMTLLFGMVLAGCQSKPKETCTGGNSEKTVQDSGREASEEIQIEKITPASTPEEELVEPTLDELQKEKEEEE